MTPLITLGALAVLALALAAGAPALAQTQPVVTPAPVYKPPLRGAPSGRVGGGTRGIGQELPTLVALAPDHTGLTIDEQPTLYWFLSKPTPQTIEITLIEWNGITPLIEHRLPAPTAAGVHRLRLAEHGVRLVPGIRYQWFVAIVPDPHYRSRDILTAAAIERVAPPASLTAAAGVHAFAEAGLWYDALRAADDAVDRHPDDPAARGQRAALLEQIGLTDVARYERAGGPR